PIPYTLYPIPYTLYPIPYTLYPIPYTLYPIPYTLYPIPYTLYPTQIGEPIPVSAKNIADISDKDVDDLHARYVSGLKGLFDKTKVKYKAYKSAELAIH
ncbi:hypothetical protein EON63_14725, partial [archaeon]